MRYVAIGLLAAVLGFGCALQTGDPGDEGTAVPGASGPSIQLGNGVNPAIKTGSGGTTPGGAASGNAPPNHPQPAPWGGPNPGTSGPASSDNAPALQGSGSVQPVEASPDMTAPVSNNPGPAATAKAKAPTGVDPLEVEAPAR